MRRLADDCLRAVKNDGGTAEQTRAALAGIAESAQNSAGQVQAISEGALQQNKMLHIITGDVDSSISTAVRSNSSAAQQTAAASEELKDQAAVMKQMIERFCLEKEEKERSDPQADAASDASEPKAHKAVG